MMAGEETGDTKFARDLAALRFNRLRLTQVEFAHRFGLSPGGVRNAEQARFSPHSALLVLVAAIELDPTLMAKAAQMARERWWYPS